MVPHRTLGLLTVGLGTQVNPLDTAVNIAFPFITGAFGVPLTAIQWIVICYVLTYACLMLICGRLGDLFGYRRMFALGLAVSAAAFVLCATAPTFEWLLVHRVLQGVGAALVVSCGPALATALYPESMRGRALGFYTMMYGVGATLGPLVGGVMIDAWGWASVFWFRAPLSLVALAMVPLLPAQRVAEARERFDVAGALLLAIGLASLLLAINQLPNLAGNLLPLVLTIAVSAVTLAGFVWQETRFPQPIVRLGVFRSFDFSLLSLANVLVHLVGFAVLLLVPYYLVQTAALPAALGGVMLAVSAVGMVLAAPLGGRLADRIPANRLGLAGAVIVAGATMAAATWPADAGYVHLALPLLAHGCGLGLFQVAFGHIATGRLSVRDRGVAGSLVMMTRTMGLVIGASTITMAFAGVQQATAVEYGSLEAAFLPAFQFTFLAAGGLLAGFIALTMLRPRLWFAQAGT